MNRNDAIVPAADSSAALDDDADGGSGGDKKALGPPAPPPGKQKFVCAHCNTHLETPSDEDVRGNLVQVKCHSCATANYLQYHCWACRTPLEGIDYTAKGVQGQCPECGAKNPAKRPRAKESCDDCGDRCVDRIMFGFTAFIQPYCVYAQCMWIYPHVMDNMDAHGSTLEKVLYGITLFVSAGTMFNYWCVRAMGTGGGGGAWSW